MSEFGFLVFLAKAVACLVAVIPIVLWLRPPVFIAGLFGILCALFLEGLIKLQIIL